MADLVARAGPAAAKDVSMAGIAGTLGMLAEAGGCGAELAVADLPRPAGATLADWITCFPGFAMLSADRPGAGGWADLPDGVVSEVCGRLTEEPGVRLQWPDGACTTAVSGPVTGLGPATGSGAIRAAGGDPRPVARRPPGPLAEWGPVAGGVAGGAGREFDSAVSGGGHRGHRTEGELTT